MRLVGQAMKGLKDSGLGGRLVELYGPGSPPVINQFDTSYWGTGLYSREDMTAPVIRDWPCPVRQTYRNLKSATQSCGVAFRSVHMTANCLLI
jgi:hypothetical protein